MKRVPFSYSTFTGVQEKAVIKAKRENTTVSTKIHNFLIAYTEGEPEPPKQALTPEAETNTVNTTLLTQPDNVTSTESAEALPVSTSDTGTSVANAAPAPQPEHIAETVEPTETGEPGEAAPTTINTGDQKTQPEGKSSAAPIKASSAARSTKKTGGSTVPKAATKKALKKVIPKAAIAPQKKNKAGKSKNGKVASKR